MTGPTYYTDAQVAALVGKSKRTIFSWRRDRRPVHGLRVVRVGTVERWVIDPAATAYLDDRPDALSPQADHQAGACDTRNRSPGSHPNDGDSRG